MIFIYKRHKMSGLEWKTQTDKRKTRRKMIMVERKNTKREKKERKRKTKKKIWKKQKRKRGKDKK